MLTSIIRRLGLASGLIAVAASASFAETARMADSFVDSIGVNTHLESQFSPYWTNFSAVVNAIKVSGIRHIRDGFWSKSGANQALSLKNQVQAATGVNVKFLFTQAAANCNPQPYNSTNPANYVSSFGFSPSDIDAFEGLNEWNSWCASASPPWYVGIRNSQQYLWSAVNGNPQLAGIPVVGPSFASGTIDQISAAASQAGDLSGYMDYGNDHNYPNDGEPSSKFGWSPSALAAMNGGHQVWTTETGYPQSYIPLDRANKYYSRLFFEFFNHGIVRSYAYELIDESNLGGGESTFGLVYANGSPKPHFNTISNIISILKDPGGGFNPGSLGYSIGGAPGTLHHTLLQKRDGTFYLVLWLEQNWWEASGPATITVNFAGPQHVNQYDPLTSASPKTAWNNAASVTLAVSDQATILEIGSSSGTGNLPDLTPTALSYDTSSHLFTVGVGNLGPVSTPSGVVIGSAFYVDGTKVSWGAVPGPLAGGSSINISSSGGGAYTISSGTHTISVLVDDLNRMAESNKNNNQLSQTITIGGAGNLPDLTPTTLSYNKSTGLFTVGVNNQGSTATPSGVVIGCAFYVDGAKVTWGAVSGPLAANASVNINSSGGGAYYIPSGTHTISVWVDDVTRMAESNKNNNQQSQQITVP